MLVTTVNGGKPTLNYTELGTLLAKVKNRLTPIDGGGEHVSNRPFGGADARLG